MLEQAKRGRMGNTTGARLAGANAWGAFGVLQYIIYEYDNLSDGDVHASESPGKSMLQQRIHSIAGKSTLCVKASKR